MTAAAPAARPALPPGPRSRVPVRLLNRFRRDPLGFLTDAARQYGDVAHWSFGPRRLYLLSHPDHIRQVLVTEQKHCIKSYVLQRSRVLLGEGLLTSEGPFHLRQRRLAQPAFHRDRIHGYGTTMVRLAVEARERWIAGQPMDVHREMMRLTLAIVAKTLFDAEVKGEEDELGAALGDALGLFDRMMMPFNELLDRLPLPATRRFTRARERLDRTIYRIIAEHRASGVDRGDLLSMLLLAQDDEGDGARMTDQQLRDEAITLFLAGHETTANALTWTWYLLAQHPAVEQRFHRELDETLDGAEPTPDQLPRLAYTRAVLAESMRLFPPAWSLGRELIADLEVGGWRIPTGSIVIMSPWVVHRDERFFPDADRFQPDRWLSEEDESRHRFAYFPFGAGTRKCIGEGFAWMEGVLLLATIGRRWRLELEPGQTVRPRALITLRPRGGIRMIPRRRGG